MPKSFRTIAGVMLLGAAFYLSSTHPSFAYLDPGSGSMILTALLGVFAATVYTVKAYLRQIAGLFRRSGQPIDGNTETKD